MDWFLYDIGLRHERVKYLVECLIFKKVALVSELNFSYNSALTAFELYGIFGSSALNLVSK